MASSQATPSPFGHLLRRFRRAANLTQEVLAARAGISLRGVSDLERGINRTPRRETVQLLADALRLAPQERSAFETAARAPMVLPGTALATRQMVPGLMATDPPAFVGRRQELARIARHLAAPATTGSRAPLLLIAGEPGIGKSRLLAEAAREAVAAGWQVISGGCTRRSGQEPYAPFSDTLARTLAHMSLAEQRHALAGCAWLVRLLPELLETAVVPAPSWSLPPEQERRLMFAAVARCLANVAGPNGTLLLLDDLQWAGADALDLLDSLVRAAAESRAGARTPEQPGLPRLRIVGAYRNTEVEVRHQLGALHTDLARAGLAAQLVLGPLPATEARALAEELVAQGTAEGAGRAVLVKRLTRRAGGVPFYLVTCAQAARASQVDEWDPPGADTVAEATPISESAVETRGEAVDGVPWLVAETIRQRVAALPESGDALLGAAALIGRVVPYALLTAVAASIGRAPELNVLSALDAACRARLLEESEEGSAEREPVGGVAQYQFAHDLIREVVLHDLGAAWRIQLHRAVAAALEHLPESKRAHERWAAEVAYHFMQAQEPARALPYTLQAGNQDEAVYAYAEAERHYRTAVDLAAGVGDQAREAEACEKQTGALRTLMRAEEALQAIERAAVLYQTCGDIEGELRALALIANLHAFAGREDACLARVCPRVAVLEAELEAAGGMRASPSLVAIYCGIAHLHGGRWRVREAEAAAAHAEQLARALGDPAVLLRALGVRALMTQTLGAGGAVARARELMALAEAARSHADLRNALHMLINGYLSEAGDFASARVHAERFVELSEQPEAQPHWGEALQMSGEVAYYRGEWPRARALFARYAAIVRRLDPSGTTWHSTYTCLWPAMLDLDGGHEEPAVQQLEAALARAERFADVQALTFAQTALAERDLLAGRAVEAQARLAPLLEREEARALPFLVAQLLPLVAWAELEAGDLEQAAKTIEAHLARTAAGINCVLRPGTLRVRALVALAQERWAEAEDALQEAITRAQAMPYPHAEAKALFVYGQLHAATGEPERARESYEAALAICTRLGEGLYRPYIERALAELSPAEDANNPRV
jgi:transcriptional regulator with XRE-family HTH domain/tetratricopeptide (TPR) repeat protein